MHGDISFQHELIMFILIWSGPGDLFLGMSVQTLFSLWGESNVLIIVSCSAEGRKEFCGGESSVGSKFFASVSKVSRGVDVGVPSVFDSDPSSKGELFLLRVG